jgi:hypothetical protein
MKKIFITIIVLAYFMVSTGIVVSFHYCMDRLQSVQLGDNHSDNCSDCGMPKKDNKGCCKDEIKVLKLQMSHTAPKALTAGLSFLPALPVIPVNFLTAPIFTSPEKTSSVAHSPPPGRQDTYLRNCVFRI